MLADNCQSCCTVPIFTPLVVLLTTSLSVILNQIMRLFLNVVCLLISNNKRFWHDGFGILPFEPRVLQMFVKRRENTRSFTKKL